MQCLSHKVENIIPLLAQIGLDACKCCLKILKTGQGCDAMGKSDDHETASGRFSVRHAAIH